MTTMLRPTNSERQLFDKVTVARRDILTPSQASYLPKVNILVVNMDAGVLTNATTFLRTERSAPKDDLDSMDIFRAVQRAGAFDFWDDPAEDVYQK